MEIYVIGKPDGRVTIQIEHSHIPGQAGYQEFIERWSKALNVLKSGFDETLSVELQEASDPKNCQ